MSSHTKRTDLPKSDNEIACCAIRISASSCVEQCLPFFCIGDMHAKIKSVEAQTTKFMAR